jgi:hypothetical protein
MELPGTSYLYTMAILAMTFIGFSAIVMLLRQTLHGKLSRLDLMIAQSYMEFGLMISVGAMLSPLLSSWELSPAIIWRVSSGLLAACVLVFAFTYPARRRKASHEPTPLYVKINLSIVYFIGIIFLINTSGALHEQSGAVFLTNLTIFLAWAVHAWLRVLHLFLGQKSR